MDRDASIAVVGTFDSKGEEHHFLKKAIERRGHNAFTINIGTKHPSPFKADLDLYEIVIQGEPAHSAGRDQAIHAVQTRAEEFVADLYKSGKIQGIISAGGGTGTHLGTGVMHVLPMGVPKVMVSTVASRDMAGIVGTSDITMMHSVVDLLGVNSISGAVLDRAAGAVCGMVRASWRPSWNKRRIALTMFGFITEGAENVKACLEEKGYEVIAFHANGTGGMAMEVLASEGMFDGILDLATHELADELKGGYCSGIGPTRLEPVSKGTIPRLVVPGGLDCAVLEFTRDSVPAEYRNRKIFFYDFRSAVRLDREETLTVADQISEKMNMKPSEVRLLVPLHGWSEADCEGGPLYDPSMRDLFLERLEERLDRHIAVQKSYTHINDRAFAELASETMDAMIAG